MTTWDYSRPAKPNESERSTDGRNKFFYCNLTSARYHLSHSHQIKVTDTETKAKRLRENRLQNIWAMAEEKNLAGAREQEAKGCETQNSARLWLAQSVTAASSERLHRL
ncbi:hypothetical protein POJ06DRAFT_257294 [Lipomyces tetrasporus]|uniref:Uncharacterized protein n=1 Tax=Lipomyces tetrasporus TaxID=54092 RepID=A0AAD7VR37_9ASCO|nr:uncharacterized protein POJ06DRAFT_257294 [Lipomyces tetrasporus]KAJ8098531.1 hypothetical protein POJ06DRAFT_257294 [Lipomyces tetrasporus]